MTRTTRRVRARKRIADAVDGALYDLERDARDAWAQVDMLRMEIERLKGVVADREGRIEAARSTFEQLRQHIPPSQRAVIDGFIPIITVVEPK